MRTQLLPALLLTLLLAACKKGGGPGSDGVNNGPEGPTPSHKPSECPEISGDYVAKDRDARKIIRSESTSRGLLFADSEQKWTVDGINRPAEGQLQLTYRGNCAAYSIFIRIYKGRQEVGEIEYSWNQRGQMHIKRTSKDPQFGESRQEVWDEKD